jgi:hypothetical protein
MESAIGVTLLLLGLGLALVSVFAWRSSVLTGVIGFVLSASCAVWLVSSLQTMDANAAWGTAPMSRTTYGLLLSLCGIVALASAAYGIGGVVRLVQSRRRAVSAVSERAPTGGTQVCRHCGRTVPAKAIACKYCERDLHPRA